MTPAQVADPAALERPPAPTRCELHRFHRPPALTFERHHVVPVAWQQAFAPPVPPFPGHDQDGRGELWDARSIALCPTSHRNVHHFIVELLKADPQPVGGTPKVLNPDDPLGYKLGRFGSRRLTREQALAYDALTRFAGAGGKLSQLIAAGQLGWA